jgi:hypothetical protein
VSQPKLAKPPAVGVYAEYGAVRSHPVRIQARHFLFCSELLNFPEKGKNKRQGDSGPNQRREVYFPYNVSLVSEESAPHI